MLKRMMKWSNSQKNVWLYLTYTMNESNKVETTVSQLCINTEYTKKVVIEALKFLEAENCIKRKPGVIMVNPRLSWNNLETTSDLEQEYLCFNT